MKYSEFIEFAKATKFEEKQWFLLWRTWRFEKTDYMQDALSEYLAINPKCKNVREMFRPELVNIGVFLKKYRRLRVVTQEGIDENLYNMPRILANCDIDYDNKLERVYFPLVYIRCPKCSLPVKKMSSEGIWTCICKYYWIDAFYNVDKIKSVWGIKDQTTPEKNVEKLEEQLPF